MKDVVAKVKLHGEHSGLDKIEHVLEGIHHKLEFLAGVEIAHKLFELVEKFGSFGEELHSASQQAGLTVQQFQALGFAASHSAVSQEELGTSIRMLSRHLYEARNGSVEAQKAFKAAGISPDQVKGFRNAQDALLALADRYNQIHDPIKKAAINQELLGRGSGRMVGFLSQGSHAIRETTHEAEHLNLVLGDDQVEALMGAEKALKTLMAVFGAISASIAANVAPLVEHVTERVMEFTAANRQLIEVNIENWLLDTAYVMGFLWGVIEIGTGLFLKFAAAIGFKDRALSLAAGLFTVVAGLLTAGKVLGFVSGSMTHLRLVMMLARGGLVTLAEGAIGLATTMIGALAPAFTAAGTAISSFLALGAGPIALIAAAIAGLVIGVHDIYTLLNGQPTWIGQFWDWLKSLEAVKAALSWITSVWDKFSSAASGIMGKISGFFGGKSAVEVSQQVNGVAGPNAVPAAIAGPQGGAQVGGPQYSVSAPITVTVPPGTPPGEVGNKVREGVADHLDQVMRQTRRSTGGAVAY